MSYPTPADDPRLAISRLCTSAVVGSVISAFWELGAMDQVNEQGWLDVDEFAASNDLDAASTLAMFRVLSAVGIVTRDGGRVTPATNFAEAYRNKSFFHWVARGSAELFRQLPELIQVKNRVGEFCKRDAVSIAFACREINTYCYDPQFWAAVDSLDFQASAVADLGCGNGERIFQLLHRYPDMRAIGIDIASPVVEVAVAEAHAAGLSSRVDFIEADVSTLTERKDFVEVDLLTCFMMGHDLWPRQRCVDTLRRLRKVFPNVRRALLGDATRNTEAADRDMPVFALPFELGHAVMGIYLPTVEDWESVFEEGGWRLCRKYPINIAVGETIFEIEPV